MFWIGLGIGFVLGAGVLWLVVAWAFRGAFKGSWGW